MQFQYYEPYKIFFACQDSRNETMLTLSIDKENDGWISGIPTTSIQDFISTSIVEQNFIFDSEFPRM